MIDVLLTSYLDRFQANQAMDKVKRSEIHVVPENKRIALFDWLIGPSLIYLIYFIIYAQHFLPYKSNNCNVSSVDVKDMKDWATHEKVADDASTKTRHHIHKQTSERMVTPIFFCSWKKFLLTFK